MSTTIEDVARQAGVSTATVSRALRGLPNVATGTRARIIHIAQELNYSIHPQVSRMAFGRKVIGIIKPLSDLWFYSKFSTTIEFKMISAEFETVHFLVESLENQAALLTRLVSSGQVDGLVIISLTLTQPQIEMLQASGLPVITVETSAPPFPSVSIDNSAAAELATRHLINLGHKRIGLIGGFADDPWKFQVPYARRDGYRRALANYAIELRPEYQTLGNFSYLGGAQAMNDLFSLHQPPTAVFAMSDEMAIGAMKTINDLNLRIPEDISIIGFDDNEVSRYFNLTSIKQPVSQYSEVAAELLFTRLSDKQNAANPPAHITLAPSLVVRATTGPPGDSR